MEPGSTGGLLKRRVVGILEKELRLPLALSPLPAFLCGPSIAPFSRDVPRRLITSTVGSGQSTFAATVQWPAVSQCGVEVNLRLAFDTIDHTLAGCTACT